MNNVEKLGAEVDARRQVGEPHRATRYSEAINRYLGAANYRELNAAQSASGARPAHTRQPERSA